MMSRIDSWHRKISTGRPNTAQIQHCPISTPFHMWVDYDVPNCFPDIEKFLPVTIFKMATTILHKFNMSLSDFNDISYVGRLWCPELIPDIEKFLPVAIFKMATTIPHKFDIVRFQRPELIPDIEKFLPVSIFKMATHHNTAKIQHCSISKVAFNLFFKPVVSGRFGRLHNR